jgi:hypothetical protein
MTMKKALLFMCFCFFASSAYAQPQTIHPSGKWKKTQKLPKISYRDNGRSASPSAAPSEYRDFGRELSGVVSKMKEVATGRERDDLKVLEFRLREYNQAVSNQDWSKADSIRDSLGVQLDRGGNVAADAGRRKAAAARAEAERRHQEEMRQKERQHQEAMARQRAIEEQLRMINRNRRGW